jgi:hypothetical protein
MGNKPPASNEVEKTPPAFSTWEKITVFSFLAVLVVIALFDRHPTNTSWYIYLCVLALAAGCIGASLPGAINVQWKKPGISASGAAALALLVVACGIYVESHQQVVRGLTSHLEIPNQDTFDPDSDVYVVIDGKLAAYRKGGHTPIQDLNFGSHVWLTGKAQVTHGPGGIGIDYDDLFPRQTIDIIAKDRSGQWWKSKDLVVPGGELLMEETDLVTVKTSLGQ